VALQPAIVLIFLAAVLPPIVLGLIVVRVVRPEPWSWLTAATAFLWGAAVTAIALALNDMAAHALPGDRIVPTLVGPVVEEAMKGTGFLAVAIALRRAPGGLRTSLVVGALVGLGFAAAENVSYYTVAGVAGGWPALGRAVYLRGVVQGLNHAAFTAATGGAIGWAIDHAATRAAFAGIVAMGLTVAIAAHSVWNAYASVAITDALCGAPVPGGPCTLAPDSRTLFVTVPLRVLAAIGPLGLALVWLVLRERERA
jgi:RsiW-degrading membrane proteinase PrsW (M82 family)